MVQSTTSPEPQGSFQHQRPRMAIRRPTGADARALTKIIRNESGGGVVMLLAAMAALLWANLAPDSYQMILHTKLGPLSIGHWASDGVFALFAAGVRVDGDLLRSLWTHPVTLE